MKEKNCGMHHSTPCRGKSVKRDYFKQQELQSILPCNSFNQTMFNQFIALLDNEFLCCVSNHESVNSARKVSKVEPYALRTCRKVKRFDNSSSKVCNSE